MKNLREKLDSLPYPVALLLTIFTFHLYGAFYRISRGDATSVILGIVWFLTGGFFAVGWFVDIYSVATHRGIVFLV